MGFAVQGRGVRAWGLGFGDSAGVQGIAFRVCKRFEWSLRFGGLGFKCQVCLESISNRGR